MIREFRRRVGQRCWAPRSFRPRTGRAGEAGTVGGSRPRGVAGHRRCLTAREAVTPCRTLAQDMALAGLLRSRRGPDRRLPAAGPAVTHRPGGYCQPARSQAGMSGICTRQLQVTSTAAVMPHQSWPRTPPPRVRHSRLPGTYTARLRGKPRGRPPGTASPTHARRGDRLPQPAPRHRDAQRPRASAGCLPGG